MEAEQEVEVLHAGLGMKATRGTQAEPRPLLVSLLSCPPGLRVHGSAPLPHFLN